MEVPENAISVTSYWTWMGPDGIARTKVKPNAEITLNHALENTKVVTSFFLDKKFPILIDSRGIKSMSREAREHFSTRGRDSKTSAFGIVIKSPLSRVIGNFFLGLNRPAVPTRLFDNETDALVWLKKHL
ncbi:MAG TPA: hypothetical protein VN026_03000 [Bacteroidia bacterium]|jgi:hypothetical protein|nr:hypothetical protein [Bacteroidia bacterium]